MQAKKIETGLTTVLYFALYSAKWAFTGMGALVATLLSGTVALAQNAAPAAGAQPPGWVQFVPFLVIIVVFYFFLIRPQAKKQKETQSFLSSLRVGDQVITNSGMLGRIVEVQDAIVGLEIANGVRIKLLKSQIMSSQAVLQAAKETAKETVKA
jgi:preprotein translocase subunit YajC